MTEHDARQQLLETFAHLLGGPDTFPSDDVQFAVDWASWATESVSQYRQCRDGEFARYGLGVERYQHLGGDPRVDLHGMVYLDLALQFRKEEICGRSFAEFAAIQPQGGYGIPLPLPPDVLGAMRAELWRVHEALEDITPPRAYDGGGRRGLSPDALIRALAGFTPGRDSPKTAWVKGRGASIHAVSSSDTWVALVDDQRKTKTGSDMAHLAPLHIALCKPQCVAEESQIGSSTGQFTVALYPSLLTAMEYFSSSAIEGEGSLGWWATLDAAESWAAGHYAELLSDGSVREPLQGGHVARWDLAQPAPVRGAGDKNKQARVVQGPSHGAAFALCLMQAVARAHSTRES